MIACTGCGGYFKYMYAIESLKTLVSIPSITGAEAEIANHVAETCDTYGHEVVKVGDNVAVRIAGVSGANALILNGHLDTVPVAENWQTDPFELINDGKDTDTFIGLGSSDMKAGLSLMLDVAREGRKEAPPTDVWLLFTSREEVDNAGARELVTWFADNRVSHYKSVGGLILEPTAAVGEAPYIGVGHRNGLILEVTAEGAEGHGSQYLNDGETAIEKLSRFIAFGLPEIRAKWATEFSHDILGPPTLNPTDYHASTGTHNSIPRTGKVTLDMRTTPSLVEALPDEIVRLQREHGVSIVSPWPPANTLCPRDAVIYRSAQVALPEASLRAFPGATDLAVFLARGIPTLLYGPGDPEAMHKPGEWVRRSAIDLCASGIERVISEFAYQGNTSDHSA